MVAASAAGLPLRAPTAPEARRHTTTRQTDPLLWAELTRPPTPHETRAWSAPPNAYGEVRTWTQHFCSSTQTAHCLVCLELVHTPTAGSPFCGERCAASFFCARSGASARYQLFERERGVCQQCGFDAHGFHQRLQALPAGPERLQALMASPYVSTAKANLQRVMRTPRAGDFWEADHIVPVEFGGGESDLSNFQTLCVRCHAAKTREQAGRTPPPHPHPLPPPPPPQAKESQKRKRAVWAQGTPDVRRFFATPGGGAADEGGEAGVVGERLAKGEVIVLE